MKAGLAVVAAALRRPDAKLMLSNLAVLALGLVSAAIQARLLGPVGRGEIAVAVVPATIISMLMCFGLPDYFARRSASAGRANRLASSAVALAVLAAAICVVPYLWFTSVHTDPASASRWIMIAYVAASPVLVYGYCGTALATGAEKWSAVALGRLLPQFAVVVGLLFLAALGISALNVGLLLVVIAIVGGLLPGALARIRPAGRPELPEMRAAVAFGLRGWPAGSIALLNQRIDLLVLTFIAAPGQLGLYAVATTLAAVLNGVAVSIALPVRNRVVHGERLVVPAATATASAVVLLVGGLLILLLPWLIPVVLGASFLPAYGAMVILILAQVPLAGVVVLTQSLIAVGRPGAPLAGELAALISTVVLVLATYPRFGIEGAAISTLFGNLVSLAVLLVLNRRYVISTRLHKFFVPSRMSLAEMRSAR